MSRPTSGVSVPTRHFDALYERSDDPWEYKTGEYEQRKYAATLAMLPPRRFASAFELGCSIGVLTAMLAARSDAVIAADCSPRAIALAVQHNALPNVRYRVMRAPEELPVGERFDLIVLSEVLYFFSASDLNAVSDFVAEATALPAATIALVNYLGPTEHEASGDDAATRFLARAEAWSRLIAQERTTDYRIDILERS